MPWEWLTKEAAVRECREETGLAVEAEGTWLVQEEEYPHGRVRLHFIACRLAGEEDGLPREPFLWAPRGKLMEYEFPAGNQEVLRRLTN